MGVMVARKIPEYNLNLACYRSVRTLLYQWRIVRIQFGACLISFPVLAAVVPLPFFSPRCEGRAWFQTTLLAIGTKDYVISFTATGIVTSNRKRLPRWVSLPDVIARVSASTALPIRRQRSCSVSQLLARLCFSTDICERKGLFLFIRHTQD